MDSQKLKSLIKTLLFLAALAALAYYFNRPQVFEQPSTPHQSEERRKTGIDERSSKSSQSEIGFATRQKLTQHFQKHGNEFGNISLSEYLRIAQTLRDKPAGGDVLEFVRADGISSRYEKSTGTFIAFNRDKTLRTCFKPNDGEAYFYRQQKKEH